MGLAEHLGIPEALHQSQQKNFHRCIVEQGSCHLTLALCPGHCRYGQLP